MHGVKLYMSSQILFLLFISCLSVNFVYAEDDLSIEKTGLLLEKTKILENFGNNSSLFQLNKLIMATLLGNSTKDIFSSDSEFSIYEKIIEEIGRDYNNIGKKEAYGILSRRDKFDLGQHDYSGMQWQKVLGTFDYGVDRQLAPDLYDDERWIVVDKIYISINAKTFLQKLKEANFIKISESKLVAFADINFIRVHKYVHFANSYEQGLMSNFNKLFLSFLYLKNFNFINMNEFEYLSREDYISFSAGAAIELPLGHGINFSIGALEGMNLIEKIHIQRTGEDDPKINDEDFLISYEKTNNQYFVTQTNLSAEFMKLLRLTLFSYEYISLYSETEELTLGLKTNVLEELINTTQEKEALDNFINHKKFDLDYLMPFIIERENRRMSEKKSKYSFLLYGEINKRSNERITIVKKNESRVFYKYYQEKIQIVKIFWKTIFNSISLSFFKSTLFKDVKAKRSRNIIVEFEDKSKKFNEIGFSDPKKFKFSIRNSYDLIDTNKKRDLKYRKYGAYFINNFTVLDKDIAISVRNNHLKSPVYISSIVTIDYQGVQELIKKTNEEYFKIAGNLCKYDYKKHRQIHRFYKSNIAKNSAYSKRIKPLRECFLQLTESFNKLKNYYDKTSQINLEKFRDLLSTINTKINHMDDLIDFFGKSNLSLNGELSAFTPSGGVFKTYFKQGNFKDQGPIQRFKQTPIRRTLASD
ncbi:MAG: hypothetical protein H6622_14870 [Halobacteriovoraceae bacterium]|nr:hypothetical protein [Halobacteriovoraceae bacterium]